MTEISEIQKIIAVFRAVCLDIFTQMTQCKIETGKVYENKQACQSNEFSIVIGVAGMYDGFVAMSLKEKTAVEIASAMMGNMPLTQLDAMTESVIGELVNIIAGKAFSQLAGDKAISITPPTFIRGKDVSFSVGVSQTTYVILLHSDKGDFEFIISLHCL